jgi:tetratricopeptide (TPR) repeat protein
LALTNRSQCYRRQGNLAAASRDLKEAMRLDPHSVLAVQRRGVGKSAAGFDLAGINVGAIVTPKQSYVTPVFENNVPTLDHVPVDPGPPVRGLNPGSTFNSPQSSESKRDSGAESTVVTERVGGGKVALSLTFGTNLNRGPSTDSAIANWTDIIRLAPNNADAFYERGLVYRKKGDYDNAIKDFSEAIRLRPDFIAAKTRLEQTRRDKAEGK